MRYYDDDDRERPSWKEIDNMKDRGGRAKREDREKEKRPPKTSYAHMQYKKKLEEFFSVGKKKEDKAKKNELKKLMEIKSKPAFMKAAAEYIDKNGYPRDLDFLLSMLDHKSSDIVSKSIEIIEQLYKDESETRQDIIMQKIHILEMTASDPRIQGVAEETLQRMKQVSSG